MLRHHQPETQVNKGLACRGRKLLGREDCGRNCNLDRQIKVLRFARIGSRIVTKGLRPLSVS